MQSLMLASQLFPDVLSGAKTNTIRWQEPRIEPGPLQLVDVSEPARSVVVEVRRCTDAPLRDSAALLGRADEWPGPVMLSRLRAHYPAIGLDDLVQVIEFDPPQNVWS